MEQQETKRIAKADAQSRGERGKPTELMSRAELQREQTKLDKLVKASIDQLILLGYGNMSTSQGVKRSIPEFIDQQHLYDKMYWVQSELNRIKLGYRKASALGRGTNALSYSTKG